ncbi:uncharacterized protein LOC128745491 [Sabethes cyaneus]|uniref:uncharacterized protein LOC128745491 n=1 Tax=Sabethes cyaneus TaxID=53552 RepID=UPI00237DA912|nr:uncharacterized protein LOC128745491 [Sabethes cyaneus]
MVVNSVRITPAGATVANSSGDIGSIDRQHSFYRTYPYPFFTYSSGFNPYGIPFGPALVESPYPVHPAATVMAQQYSPKYGQPSESGYDGSDGIGYGSSYGPPGPPHPSGGAVYEYHAPPAPPSVSHPHPVPFQFRASKPKKGKGAALSALTLLAFLYFLNMLQSCLKEHMDTMNPTVMVMTAGATRRKDADEVTLTESDEKVGEYDAPGEVDFTDDRFHLVTKSPGGFSSFVNDKPVRKYKFRKSNSDDEQ